MALKPGRKDGLKFGTKPWNEQEDDIVRRMRLAGLDHATIGEAIDRTPGSVAYRIRTLFKGTEHEGAQLPQGLNLNEAVGGGSKSWTIKEMQRMLDLWLGAMSPADIGRDLGRTTRAIYAKTAKMSYPRRNADYTLCEHEEPGRNWNPRIRPCMTCEEAFFSTHNGNRMCRECIRYDHNRKLL